MFKLFITSLIILLSYFSVNAQPSLSIYSGFGRSSFDKDLFGKIIDSYEPDLNLGQNLELDQSSFVPIGAQLIINLPIISIGAEVNYTVSPYKFDVRAANISIGQTNIEHAKLAETTLKQLMFGVFVKLKLLPGPIVPYARVGAGLYNGDFEFNYTDDAKLIAQFANIDLPEKISAKNAVGANIGAGVEINFNESGGLFGEVIYNFVLKEPEVKNSDSFSANNYAIQIGYQFRL